MFKLRCNYSLDDLTILVSTAIILLQSLMIELNLVIKIFRFVQQIEPIACFGGFF